jgi:WD40 repeat protein/serine/threonine protein kinase
VEGDAVPIDPARVQAVFLAAAEEERAAGRAVLLDNLCGADAELRQRVETLLRAHDAPGSFLGSAATDPVATVDEQPLREGPGTMIGAYKLLEQIGEGGFGVVFMAEQQQPVRRKVALKVLKPGMDSALVIARFEAERQALALMDHPNIAKVHDGGSTPSSRPYFVMELVKGVPITELCDQNHLTPRERLELFIPVCLATQHAHQKGIIHRDLKPSNVLVMMHDTTPVPKIIDFGVAKALGQELTDKTLFTGFAQMIGTPLYMSPEQAGLSDLDIDTRSDIYALGVLLYELLTGSTPFSKKRFKQAAYDEIRRIIREEEPPRPSTRLSESKDALPSISAQRRMEPARLTKLVRGELDWIVMKALEKDRTRRYESASALAADVQRYLHDEPVQACPPSAWYRFRKFARRNKAGVVTATSLALGGLLAIGGLVSALLVQASSSAEVRAEQKQTQGALDRERRTNDSLVLSLSREQHASYLRSIALADRELAINNVGRAEELLDGCPLRLRGWEWDYLKRRPCGPLTLTVPGAAVWGVAFSPEGKHLAATGVLLPGVTVWDRATGKQVRRLAGTGRAERLAYSPDGKHLVAAGVDGRVRVWDVTAAKEVRALQGHEGCVVSVAYSPDGKLLASASWDRTVILWDALTWQQLRVLRGHTKGVHGIAFAPDGSRLASASSDGTVRVWEVKTGRELHTLRGHAGPVMNVAFARDGLLASAGFDGTVKLWNATAGRYLDTLRADIALLFAVAVSPDGKRLATGGLERSVHVWDLEARQEVLTLRGHGDIVSDLAFSPDGHQLASASGDGTVKVWGAGPASANAGPEALTLRGHNGAALGVVFHPDGRRLASAGGDETVRLWDTTTGEELAMLRGHAGPVWGLALSRDGRVLASTSSGGVVHLWDVEARKERRTFRGFAAAVALSPDGGRVASASEEGLLFVWDTATGKEAIPPWRAHGSSVVGLAFSPDGRRLATTSMDGTAKIWDAATGRSVLALTGHRSIIQSVAFSADGKRLATASWDKTAKVCDAATGKELLTLHGHDDRVLGVAFSPDGKLLATASWDNTAKVWDAATGKAIATLRGHTGYVCGVAFSRDGKRLASAGGYRGKGEVKVWDASPWGVQPGH